MVSNSPFPGGGRLGGKVIACGVAMLLAAAFAMRAVEAGFSGNVSAAALQGVLAIAAAIAAFALWTRMKRASDERVLWEMRIGRRDAAGRLRSDGEDDGGESR